MKRAIAILLLVASCNAADACGGRFRIRRPATQRPVIQRPVIQRPVIQRPVIQATPKVVCVDGKCYTK